MKTTISFKSEKNSKQIYVKIYTDNEAQIIQIHYPEKTYLRTKPYFMIIERLAENICDGIPAKNFDYEKLANTNFGEKEIRNAKIEIEKVRLQRSTAKNRLDLLSKLLEKPAFYEFLSTLSKSTLSRLVNTNFTRDQTQLLITKMNDSFILYDLGKKEIAISRLTNNLDNIKRGRPTKFPILSIGYKNIAGEEICEKTYSGFLRALRSKTLQIGKVNVGGTEKVVFLKNAIGSKEPILGGINNLFIEPTTMDVYSFTTDKCGNINNYKKELSANLNELSLKVKNNPKQLAKIRKFIDAFKEELPVYLDKAYAKDGVGGLKRIKRLEKLKQEHEKRIERKKKTNKLKTIVKRIFKK